MIYLIKFYDNIRDDNHNIVNGLTKLFIERADDDGNIENYLHGKLVTPEGTGTMFIVDDWLIQQLSKVKFKDGTLSVKDGAELIPPVKSEKQLRVEELQRQMAELQAMPDEPADTERQTDAPLLDYTDKPTE